MTSAKRVLIIGGGVIGAACAHWLCEAGAAVTLIERGAFGSGCSHGNCGFVCPSHILPLAVPGAVGNTLKALLRPNSPFSIKPRLDPHLWSWMYQFTRRCNSRDMLSAGRAIQALLDSSRTLYEELFNAGAVAAEWETRGLLFAFDTAAAFDHFEHTNQEMMQTFGAGAGATRYDARAVVELEPALKPTVAGGYHYPGDAHLRPDRLMASWKAALTARGVTIRERCEFRGFINSGQHPTAAETSHGPLEADSFVIATGAWTPLLKDAFGFRLPIEPGKGYSITMPRPKNCPKIPLIFEEHRVAVTPMQTGYRIGSTMEFAGYDTTVNRSRLQLLRDGAAHYLIEPFAEPVQEEWFGWRPMTYDGKPVIDRSPRHGNVYLACGHNMLGLSMAPATGKLLSELICGQTPHLPLEPYTARRFV